MARADVKGAFVRMMRKVEPAPDCDCLIFKGAHKPRGYGNVRFFNGVRWTVISAHAISARHVKRRKLGAGLVWRHTCDTPACVNPRHLIPGTHRQNFWDSVERERAAEPFLGYKRRDPDEIPF